MTRVCFLLGGFQGNGGIGRVTSILANNLCKDENYEIHTISYFHDERPQLYKTSPMVKNHVLYTSKCSMTKAILFKHAIKKVKTIIDNEKIDVLIACGALYYPLAVLSCRKSGTMCICWEHINPSTNTDYKFQNYCRKFGAKHCDHIVVLTKAAEKYYVTHFPFCKNMISQIYNPIDDEAIKSGEYDVDSCRIITVGRLNYQKNIERLISIAARVLPEYPDWAWDVYGDGDLRDSLQKQIDDNGLTGRVTLKGQVMDLYSRYKSYAFMVMTSRYEGFPMTLIEGAANRLPLVAFDVPTGPNEIIVDGTNGYLIDSNSDDEMVKKIQKLIEEPKTREKFSEEVGRLTEVFALERILEQWKLLLREKA